jgi:hypothetical protein
MKSKADKDRHIILTDEGREFFRNLTAGRKKVTKGVELLAHMRDAGAEEKLWTATLIDRLVSREESPWKDIRGKALDDRGLASRLKAFGIKSRDVWFGDGGKGRTKKGYHAADFADAWKRYLPSCHP